MLHRHITCAGGMVTLMPVISVSLVQYNCTVPSTVLCTDSTTPKKCRGLDETLFVWKWLSCGVIVSYLTTDSLGFVSALHHTTMHLSTRQVCEMAQNLRNMSLSYPRFPFFLPSFSIERTSWFVNLVIRASDDLPDP